MGYPCANFDFRGYTGVKQVKRLGKRSAGKFSRAAHSPHYTLPRHHVETGKILNVSSECAHDLLCPHFQNFSIKTSR